MSLIYSAEFKCRIYKVRKFDNDIRVRPALISFLDFEILCQVPKVVMYDSCIYYMRQIEELTDPFTASKDDASSFFAINEQRNDLIESTYISTNLKIMASFSEALNKPVSRFDSVKSLSAAKMSQSGTDAYIALNFEDIEDFTNMEIVRAGFSCVITGCTAATVSTSKYNLFDTVADCTNVRYAGILSSFSLTQNYETTAYCSFYYGVIYAPNDATTYYFSLVASSVGYMFIDDVLFISQSSENSVTAATNSIMLSKGYHTFIIKHYASAASTNDMVRLQYKTSSGASYSDFTVTNLATSNCPVVTFPTYAEDILAESATFADMPSVINDPSLDSLYIKSFRPIIVLARKFSELLQKEFNRIYYKRVPDIVTSSAILQGTLTDILTPYDFALLANGITLNCNRNTVLSPFITYTYNAPVKISVFELLDAPLNSSTASDQKQCWSFTFSIVDSLNERVRATDLVELIDLGASRNVEMLQTVSNSDTYIRVIKKKTNLHTIIVFKDYVIIRELTIRDPIVPGIEWGSILSLQVRLKATEIVKLIDNKGEMSIIQNINDETLVAVDYDGLGYIPTVFNHKSIAPDIQYGAEFIMYCLNVLGQVTPVTTLGNMYTVANYDDHIVFDSDHILNVKQLSQVDDRKFEVATSPAKTEHYEFAHVGYSTSQDVVMQTDYATILVDVTNTSAGTLTNLTYNIDAPNIGTGYSCVNQSMSVVPIAGVLKAGTLTADPDLWDTQIVRVKIASILAGATETLTLSTGTFSVITDVTGTAATTYTFLPNLVQLPLIVTRIPSMAELSTENVAVMTATSFPAASSTTFTVPSKLTVASIMVTELTGTTRSNVEVVVDVADLLNTFQCTFRVYDAETRTSLDTVGINNDNSATASFSAWDGYRIRFRIPSLKGGIASMFLIRVGTFQGSASSFVPSVQTGMAHNIHFSGSLVDSVTGTIGTNYGATYNTDKTLEYYRALQCTNNGYSRVSVTTTTNNFSLSFWFITPKSSCGILCLSNTAALPATVNDLKFSINANGQLVCTIVSGVGSTMTATDKSYIDNQWHHVVLTSSSTAGMKLYVDAVELGSNTILSRTITTAYAYLGWSDSYFTGSIDEFRIYTKCLTAGEVSVLKTIFDGNVSETIQQYQRTNIVHSPVSRVTTISDTSALTGTPMYIYKYMDIDETIVRYI